MNNVQETDGNKIRFMNAAVAQVYINIKKYDEVKTIHYDEQTGKGYIDYRIIDRDIAKDFVEPGAENEIDVYIDQDELRLKLEINEVQFTGSSMTLDANDLMFSRRIYFYFSTTTFDTYDIEDAPWYGLSRETVEV